MVLSNYRSTSYEVGLTINSKLLKNILFICPESVPLLLREVVENKHYKTKYWLSNIIPPELYDLPPEIYDLSSQGHRAIHTGREELWTVHLTHADTLQCGLSEVEHTINFVRPFDPEQYHLIVVGDHIKDTFEYGHLREDVRVLPTLVYGGN